MTAGLVSVIVPAYQAARFLDQALACALDQDYRAVEVIVVDDGSTDATSKVAARRPVQLLRRPHRGVAAARNAGLELARGDFVTFLDADDLWPRDRLSRQVDHLQRRPSLGMVLGLTKIFLSPGERRPAHWPAVVADQPVPGVAGSMLARRAAFLSVGGFDETLQICEDIDWLARAKDAGIRAGAIPEIVLHYRIHADNTSRHSRQNEAELLRVLRHSVHRQRELTDA